MNVVFDQANHTYSLDGMTIPSITRIIAWGTGHPLPAKPTWHMQRGTATHQAILMHLQNDLDENALDPQLLPFLNAFKVWREMARFEPLIELCEKPMASTLHRYGGTPDLIGMIDGKLHLVEVKTGTAPSWIQYQLAAQKNLDELAALGDELMPSFLELKEVRPQGPVKFRFRLQPHANERAFETFLHWKNNFPCNVDPC